MPDIVADLAEQGRSLSPQDRVRLLDLLLESLQEPALAAGNADAWTREIERRVAAQERGEGTLHEMDEVLAEAARIAP